MNRDLARARDIIRTDIPEVLGERLLFGSRGRGDARHGSDIDVAVRPRSPLPLGFLAQTLAAPEESSLLLDVDLTDLDEAGNTLRQEIEREGIPWNG